MKIKGMMVVVLGLLIVVVLAWVAITVVDSVTNVEVNANAESLRNPIQDSFDTSQLTEVNEKVSELEVSPEVFHALEDEGIEGLKQKSENEKSSGTEDKEDDSEAASENTEDSPSE
jgi:hypothetical protein